MATAAPLLANTSTAASPMPDEPPVTRTVLPERSALIIRAPFPLSPLLILRGISKRCVPKTQHLDARPPHPRSGGGGPCEAWWRGQSQARYVSLPPPPPSAVPLPRRSATGEETLVHASRRH